MNFTFVSIYILVVHKYLTTTYSTQILGHANKLLESKVQKNAWWHIIYLECISHFPLKTILHFYYANRLCLLIVFIIKIFNF
jgi:hypothetical protein